MSAPKSFKTTTGVSGVYRWRGDRLVIFFNQKKNHSMCCDTEWHEGWKPSTGLTARNKEWWSIVVVGNHSDVRTNEILNAAQFESVKKKN